eukprot:1142036-Pelagomonas_calceolata.AAC.1
MGGTLRRSDAMGKTKKGHSAGEYKSSLKHSVSNKFQAGWLQEDDRHLWLEDYGMDVDVSSRNPQAGCQAPSEGAAAGATAARAAAAGAAASCQQEARTKHSREPGMEQCGTSVMQAGSVDFELQAVSPPTANQRCSVRHAAASLDIKQRVEQQVTDKLALAAL